MTTALEGGEGSVSRPGRSLPPGKTRYPLYRRLGGPQGRSGQVQKISPPPRFDPRTVQAVASRYTDWATRPTACKVLERITAHRLRSCVKFRWHNFNIRSCLGFEGRFTFSGIFKVYCPKRAVNFWYFMVTFIDELLNKWVKRIGGMAGTG